MTEYEKSEYRNWLRFGHRKSNIENLLKALKDFGFASLKLKLDDFPEHILPLGHPPNRIDLHTDLPGVDFKTCYKNRVKVEIEGVNANFIDLENLGKRQATGRHQDLADPENLE